MANKKISEFPITTSVAALYLDGIDMTRPVGQQNVRIAPEVLIPEGMTKAGIEQIMGIGPGLVLVDGILSMEGSASPIKSITEFGGYPSNTPAQNVVAFQAAIDYGGLIYVDEGRYLIDDILLPKSHCTMMGAGIDRTIIATVGTTDDAGKIFRQYEGFVEYFGIRDMTLTVDLPISDDNSSSALITLDHCSSRGYLVERVKFTHDRPYGGNGFTTVLGDYGVLCADFTLRDCVFDGVGRFGIEMLNQIDGWYANTGYTAGRMARPSNGHGMGSDFLVMTSGLTGATEPVWPTALGAEVTSGAVTFRNIGPQYNLQNFSTVRCVFRNIGNAHGGWAHSFSGRAKGCLIADNVFEATSGWPIIVENAGASYSIYTGNRIYMAEGSESQTGISVSEEFPEMIHNIYSHNVIYGPNSPNQCCRLADTSFSKFVNNILVNSTGAALLVVNNRNTDVAGNTFISQGEHPVGFDNSHGCTFLRNSVDNTAGVSNASGCVLFNNSAHNLIDDNLFRLGAGGTQGPADLDGTNSIGSFWIDDGTSYTAGGGSGGPAGPKSIADFGGSPGADPLVNWQAFWDAALSGGRIYVPAGTYDIGDIILPRDSVTFFGDGMDRTILRGVSLDQDPGCVIRFFDNGPEGPVNDFHMSDMTLTTTAAVAVDSGIGLVWIEWTGATNCSFKRMRFSAPNSATNGFTSWAGHPVPSISLDPTAGQSLNHSWVIEDCVFENIGRHAIEMLNRPDEFVASIPYLLNYITQPIVPNGLDYRVTVPGMSGATEPVWPTVVGATVTSGTVTWECIPPQYMIHDVTIQRCIFRKIGGMVGIPGKAISVNGRAARLTIEGNTFEADAGAANECMLENAGFSFSTVRNNTFLDWGTRIPLRVVTARFDIQGNLYTGNHFLGGASTQPIHIESDRDSKFAGNWVRMGDGACINVVSCARVEISDNLFAAVGDTPVILTSSDSLQLLRNTIDNTATDTNSAPVLLQGGTHHTIATGNIYRLGPLGFRYAFEADIATITNNKVRDGNYDFNGTDYIFEGYSTGVVPFNTIGLYGGSPTAAGTVNSVAFQAAIDAGGPCYVPAGTYDIDGVLLPKSNMSFYGDGASTILRSISTLDSGMVFRLYSGKLRDFHLRDLRLSTNRTTSVGSANALFYVERLGVQNVSFTNVTFEVPLNGSNAVTLQYGGPTVYTEDCQDLRFIDCQFVNIGRMAIEYIGLWDGFSASTAYALDAIVVPTPMNGLEYRVTVAGTTGASPPVWPTTVGATVVSGTVTFTAMDLPSLRNMTVSGCHFAAIGQKPGEVGKSISINGKAIDCTIEDNLFDQLPASIGANILENAGMQYSVIRGNTFVDWGTSTPIVSLGDGRGMRENLYTENQFRGLSSTVPMTISAETKSRIFDNTIELGVSAAIIVTGCSQVEVTDNYFKTAADNATGFNGTNNSLFARNTVDNTAAAFNAAGLILFGGSAVNLIKDNIFRLSAGGSPINNGGDVTNIQVGNYQDSGSALTLVP